MTIRRLVLDSGVLDRADGEQVLHRIRSYAARGWEIAIPTVTLAEATRGSKHDARVDRTVQRFGTTSTDEPTARRAGALRAGVRRVGRGPLPSAIDAIVAAHALGAERAVVLTTDAGDLSRLLVDLPHIVVERA